MNRRPFRLAGQFVLLLLFFGAVLSALIILGAMIAPVAP